MKAIFCLKKLDQKFFQLINNKFSVMASGLSLFHYGIDFSIKYSSVRRNQKLILNKLLTFTFNVTKLHGHQVEKWDSKLWKLENRIFLLKNQMNIWNFYLLVNNNPNFPSSLIEELITWPKKAFKELSWLKKRLYYK